MPARPSPRRLSAFGFIGVSASRSEEHTSELQSPDHLVCRLLLEKKNTITTAAASHTIYVVSCAKDMMQLFSNSVCVLKQYSDNLSFDAPAMQESIALRSERVVQ